MNFVAMRSSRSCLPNFAVYLNMHRRILTLLGNRFMNMSSKCGYCSAEGYKFENIRMEWRIVTDSTGSGTSLYLRLVWWVAPGPDGVQRQGSENDRYWITG